MNPYLYEEKGTVVHRLDPRTKLFILAATFFLMLVPSSLPLALASFAFVAVHASLARAWDTIARLRKFLFIISVFTIVIWTLVPRGDEILWLFFRRDSLLFGLLTAVKIVGILFAGIVFLVTTRNEEITVGLVKLGVPYVACFAFSMALRLVPTFAQTGMTVVEAQQSRGLELQKGSLWRRMRNYIPLMVPIFLVSIRNANLMAMALEARGFGARGKRTFYLQTRMRPLDWLALTITAVAAALVIVGQFLF
jgi:energy-coupling factor transport system permease protein